MSTIILGSQGNLGQQLKKAFINELEAAWDHVDFDFLDFKLLAKKLDETQASLIINAAAYNAVDNCENDKEAKILAYKLNRDLPAFLADYALEKGIKLMHYSTDYVFGGDNRLTRPCQELDQAYPVNEYGRNKVVGKKEVAKRALLGLQYYLVRTSKLFGPLGSGNFVKPSFFDLMMKLAKEQDSLQVIDGELSCFTYTPDLAQASWQLYTDQAPRGIYHLCNSEAATWYEAALYLFKNLKLDVQVKAIKSEDWSRAALRPNFSVLANTRRPLLRSWREALDEYLKNLVENNY